MLVWKKAMGGGGKAAGEVKVMEENTGGLHM
jgi:hypothetical protein